MKSLYGFLLTFLLSSQILAQNNYVATSPTSTTPGGLNVIVGIGAGKTTMTGSQNTFVGFMTGSQSTTGSQNTFIGSYAGSSNTIGINNTFLGFTAGRTNATGDFNVFVGYQAGFDNFSGDNNMFLGSNAGQRNRSGNNNAFVGPGAGFNNLSGNQNTFLGNQAGFNSLGNNNTFVGVDAGKNNTNGGNNTMLGHNAQPVSGSLQNAVAIGYNATVALNNAIVLGDPANTSIAVGIGTDSPQFPLDVRGIINLRNNGRIKFAHLSNPLFQGTTDQFLTVNEVGETVLARHRLRIDNVTQWSDKVFAPTYQLPTLSEVERYITLHRHLSNVPSAQDVVKEGVDLVRMNATLLEKVEELTLYSIQQDKMIKQQQLDNQKLKQEMVELKALVKQVLEKK
ncbi:hypothetical protein [Spirosoma flavus]